MKFIIALFFSLPISVIAASYGGASGKNSKGETIHIEGDTADTIYVQKNLNDQKWKERYDFKKECPNFTDTYNEGKEYFSCRSDSKSPLAGTKYRITTSKSYVPCNVDPFFDKSPGEIYICVSGCTNPRAPKKFLVSPWEC